MNNLLSKDDNYYMGNRQDMLKFIDIKANRILEIGCGEGNFAANFTDVEYWGVEAVTQHAKAAEQKGFKILNGLYEDVEDKIPNAYFDLIVCNDVIEHMLDPMLFLKKIRNKLTPSGTKSSFKCSTLLYVVFLNLFNGYIRGIIKAQANDATHTVK